MLDAYHLYTISFTVGKESGIALVAATSDRDAFQILKNGGSRHGEGYSLTQCRDIGMTSNCSYGLLMESFVNAKEAYDAIVAAANKIVGPKGDKGDKGYYDGVSISVGENIGTPTASVSVSEIDDGKSLDFHFDGLKGERGEQGVSIEKIEQTTVSDDDSGTNVITITLDDGTASKAYVKNGRCGVTDVTATVDSIPGTPHVVPYLDEDGVLSLAFYGIRGVQGEPGMNDTVMTIVDALPAEASEETKDIIYLIYNGYTGEYDRYYTAVNGNTYTFVQAGSTSIDLSDYIRKDSEVWLTQEEFDAIPVKDITKTYNIYEEDDYYPYGSGSGAGSGSGSGFGVNNQIDTA